MDKGKISLDKSPKLSKDINKTSRMLGSIVLHLFVLQGTCANISTQT